MSDPKALSSPLTNIANNHVEIFLRQLLGCMLIERFCLGSKTHQESVSFALTNLRQDILVSDKIQHHLIFFLFHLFSTGVPKSVVADSGRFDDDIRVFEMLKDCGRHLGCCLNTNHLYVIRISKT